MYPVPFCCCGQLDDRITRLVEGVKGGRDVLVLDRKIVRI